MGETRIALIRGINVGRAKRVPMAGLRAALADLGYGDVRTLLNSGNAVFTATYSPGDCAAAIEAALASRLGVTARVVVLDAAALDAIIAGNPLLDVADDMSRLFAAVLLDPTDRPRLDPLLDRDWGEERIAAGPCAAWIWCPRGLQAARVPAAVDRAVGGAVTTRNWATIMKLRALAR